MFQRPKYSKQLHADRVNTGARDTHRDRDNSTQQNAAPENGISNQNCHMSSVEVNRAVDAFVNCERHSETQHSPGVRFSPDGLHFEGVQFTDEITLSQRILNFRIRFSRCEFLLGADFRWLHAAELSFEHSNFLNPLHAHSMNLEGHLDFSHCASAVHTDISLSRISGDLKLRHARFSVAPDKQLFDTDSPRYASTLFAAGINCHSVLMESFESFGCAFFDAGNLTGIFLATDAKLHSHYSTRSLQDDENKKKSPLNQWDHLALSATDCTIEGAVILGRDPRGNPFEPKVQLQCHGQISFSNTILRGDLICSGANLQSAYAQSSQEVLIKLAALDDLPLATLHFSRAIIEGSVFLDYQFRSLGEVRFNGVEVKGDFGCNRATFDGRFSGHTPRPNDSRAYLANTSVIHAKALTLKRAAIGSDVNLNFGFLAFGSVNLRSAKLGGDLNCVGGTIHGCYESDAKPDLKKQPETLAASGVDVSGHVKLCVNSGVQKRESDDEHFASYGEVRIRGAKIKGNFHLEGGLFDTAEHDFELAKSKKAQPGFSMNRILSLFQRRNLRSRGNSTRDAATVARFESLTVNGTTFLSNSQIREQNKDSKFNHYAKFGGSVSFAGMITDAWEDWEDCWPDASPCGAGRAFIELNGLTYNRLAGPLSGPRRIAWLVQQPEHDLVRPEEDILHLTKDWGFKAQPWEQCAKALRENGYRRDAALLLQVAQKFTRLHGRLNRAERFYNGALGILVGHGYRADFALYWAAIVLISGAIIFNFGWQVGQFHPLKSETLNEDHYCDINSLLYSGDVLLPGMDLYWQNRWSIDAKIPTSAPQEVCDTDSAAPLLNERMAEITTTLTQLATQLRFEEHLSHLASTISTLIADSNLLPNAQLVLALFVIIAIATRSTTAKAMSRAKKSIQSSRFKILSTFFGIPNFSGDYSRTWLDSFKRACRLEKSGFRSLLAPYGGPAITSIAIFLIFTIFVTYRFAAPEQTRQLLAWLDWTWSAYFSVCFLRGWYAFETVVGWILISAVAVGAASTITRSDRTRQYTLPFANSNKTSCRDI
ncbi:MAG: hypothetical protein ABL973_20515 [Micropepsaceae bacterium]